MRRVMLLLCTLLLLTAAWSAPDNIIVKYDEEYGGNYLADAIGHIWPDCDAWYYDGNSWSSFISALQGDEWDMCVVAAMNYTTFDSGHYSALVDYYDEYYRLHYFDWYAHGSDNNALETAMGAGNPISMGFTPNHYFWDAYYQIDYKIDSWTLDMHGWDFSVYHHRYPWTTAEPVTGWTASETAYQAGFMVAENGVGVITGLYASFIGGGQERQLWENILKGMWGWWQHHSIQIYDLNPDDGDSGVPVDTDIVFHCCSYVGDGYGRIDLDTLVFTVEDQSRRSGDRALRVGSPLLSSHSNPRPAGEISGTLDIDDSDWYDVICTFTPDSDLPVDRITCTVDGCLADRDGYEMGEDFVWTFSTGNYGVEQTTWGAIKAGF